MVVVSRFHFLDRFDSNIHNMQYVPQVRTCQKEVGYLKLTKLYVLDVATDFTLINSLLSTS
jgi:hypothetical protein